MPRPTFLRAPSARTLSVPTRKPRRVALRRPLRVPLPLEPERAFCCLACARRADRRAVELRHARRQRESDAWLGGVGRVVLVVIYVSYVWAVFTPPFDVPPEVPAEEYELGAWP